MNELKDERGGKPSASNGEAYELCNGRHQMESGLTDYTSDAAEEGNRVHLWLEDDTLIKLEGEELSLAEEMLAQRNTVMDMVFPDWRENPPTIIEKEKRLWYNGARYSGKTDYFAIGDRKALILDYKCGRIPVTPAKDNGQMRWNVGLLDRHYAFDEVTVVLVQPRCGPPSIHTFDKKGVKKCRQKVTRTLRLMESANPKLRAGEKQCKYCKAKTMCPELSKRQDALSTVQDTEALTNDQISTLLDVIPAVEARCKAIKEHAKELLRNNPSCLEGWALVTPSATRSVTSPRRAFKRMEEESLIDAEKFLNACSVSITKLQREVVDHTGMGPTEAKRTISTVLGDAMGEKQREPSIKKAG